MLKAEAVEHRFFVVERLAGNNKNGCGSSDGETKGFQAIVAKSAAGWGGFFITPFGWCARLTRETRRVLT